MMSYKIFFTLLLCLLGITIMQGCGTTYTGRIAVKGSEPFTYLALVTGDGDMKITGPLEKKLREDFQGMVVTVRGAIVKEGGGFMKPPELRVTGIVTGEE